MTCCCAFAGPIVQCLESKTARTIDIRSEKEEIRTKIVLDQILRAFDLLSLFDLAGGDREHVSKRTCVRVPEKLVVISEGDEDTSLNGRVSITDLCFTLADVPEMSCKSKLENLSAVILPNMSRWFTHVPVFLQRSKLNYSHLLRQRNCHSYWVAVAISTKVRAHQKWLSSTQWSIIFH